MLNKLSNAFNQHARKLVFLFAVALVLGGGSVVVASPPPAAPYAMDAALQPAAWIGTMMGIVSPAVVTLVGAALGLTIIGWVYRVIRRRMAGSVG